jgi:hypothetical protein
MVCGASKGAHEYDAGRAWLPCLTLRLAANNCRRESFTASRSNGRGAAYLGKEQNMGCDIHFYVEVKRDGQWTHHDWEKPYVVGKYSDGSVDFSRMMKDPLYIGRNYVLFSVLADVRNDYGISPIQSVRGLPADVSSAIMDEHTVRVDENHEQATLDRWVAEGYSNRITETSVTDPDDHSASWFTLAELQAFDWSLPISRGGWVDVENFKLFRDSGKPKAWCKSAGGGRIQHVDNATMADRIGLGTAENCFTEVQWTEPLSECVPHFLNDSIPALAKLGNPDDVRIVFWFDN